jgi:hypothetical protein
MPRRSHSKGGISFMTSLPILLAICCQIAVVNGESYYSILGVRKDAKSEEIKRAYRELAKIWHPDKNDDPHAQEKFVAISEAYENLGNDKSRATYDYSLQTGSSHSSRGQKRNPFNTARQYEFHDVRSFFNDMERSKRGQQGRSGFSYSFHADASSSSGLKMLLASSMVVILSWVCLMSSLCYFCCGGKKKSENHKETNASDDTTGSTIATPAPTPEIPLYNYSMKLRKGFLVVSCNDRTAMVLQDIFAAGKFKNDPISFANRRGTDCRGMDGEIYGVIVVCLKGTKWSGHTIIDSDIETWVEKILCGEISLKYSDMEPCPI